MNIDSGKWTQVTPDQKNLWVPGVFAITNGSSAKHFFVATSNLGRRLRDNHRWLLSGSHRNPGLQADWDTDPDQFHWYAVERVSRTWLLPDLKQGLIDAFGPSRCYNLKNAVPRRGRPHSQRQLSFTWLSALPEVRVKEPFLREGPAAAVGQAMSHSL